MNAITKKTEKHYHCYSTNLVKYLKENGLSPIEVTLHRTNGKTIWIFEHSDKLSALLTNWTKRKRNMQGNAELIAV